MMMSQQSGALPADVQEVYAELQALANKLRNEHKILQEREIILRERERLVVRSHANVKTYAQEEVNKKWAVIEEEHIAEISKMEQILREKSKENKRLKDNFETIKQANDSLKKELEGLQEQHEKLEKQTASLQARLANLQRKQEFVGRQTVENIPPTTIRSKPPSAVEAKDGKHLLPKPKLPSSMHDVTSLLLDWVSEVHLRHTALGQPTAESQLPSIQDTQEKCFKVLPSLVEILRDLPASNARVTLPCLQFIYWSLLHLDKAQSQQKSNLSSTLRRVGEELYRPKSTRLGSSGELSSERPLSPVKADKTKDLVFFRSTSLHVRLLSCLIILKTLSQVDHLAHVFDVLKMDLKSESAKELFIHYRASPVIISFFKPASKALMTCAMDVYLQMSMESLNLHQFLESISTESWFRACSVILRAPNLENKMVEKLSIVLQKLSKIKNNKKYFEVFTITGLVQEALRSYGKDNAFLAMNLKSILLNLNMAV
ncbi:coiled-coil domain-containing protein 138 isoform X2 [Lingula anatina]|nr:coiled-coil domain-containing protein 138 isoform X2 [Lingula anatina]|eukprot:XP_013389545.1 coiled-coil domain-containing protein 138 isoform X2 [Lingula anatina]